PRCVRAAVFFPFDCCPPSRRSCPTRRSSDLALRRTGSEEVEHGRASEQRLPICRSGSAGAEEASAAAAQDPLYRDQRAVQAAGGDRKSTRLNSSHVKNSYAVFCLKKKTGCSRAHYVFPHGNSLGTLDFSDYPESAHAALDSYVNPDCHQLASCTEPGCTRERFPAR